MEIPATTLKITVKTDVDNSGLIKIQSGPKMVCLYEVVRLRLTNKRIKSR